jgi:dipeptidyl aminopeptidase/acylaminoacyl peptidase
LIFAHGLSQSHDAAVANDVKEAARRVVRIIRALMFKERVMSLFGDHRQVTSRVRRVGLGALVLLAAGGMLRAVTEAAPPPVEMTRRTGANYKQARQYSNEFLRQFTYSTTVEPHWIGKTDSFWYEYQTSKGKQWYRVHPRDRSREPLFDRVQVAALLSEQVRKPLDPLQLPLARASLTDDAAKFKFVAEDYQFEYDLAAGKLVKIGKAPPLPKGPGTLNPEQRQRLRALLGEERLNQYEEQQRLQSEAGISADLVEEEGLSGDDLRLIEDELRQMDRTPTPLAQEQDQNAQQKKVGEGGKKGPDKEDRSYSSDHKMHAFVKNHNLYIAEEGKEDQAIQLTHDGSEDYTFATGFGGGFFRRKRDLKDKDDQDQQREDRQRTDEDKSGKGTKDDKDKKRPAPVTWSKDSRAFYVLRRDDRAVKELYLIDALAQPRPALVKYKYAMPGEEKVRKTELYVFRKDGNKFVQVAPHWKDESYSDLHWGKTSDELRFVRGDRLHRNIEFCTFNSAGGDTKCLILEGFENSSIVTRPVKYLDDSDEMIWWSERSGWGHFYLYDRAGKLKNAITSGDFRASAIVAVDAKNRLLYFRANAREPGESVYFNHLYSVRLDGTGLTLMDLGDANHDSRLSESHEVVVDNYSRVDLAPATVLRDARGHKLMDLEKADLSRLTEVGWKMPETFSVKAADGVTDLYGNLYKPFDFDPGKKYPIIAHVYPGPQTESTPHAFVASSGQQQLAQLGFIVIQVGNRGGTPLRSKAYQSYSYGNLRDYGLADKKSAIEQLAARHAWIDIDRVGIYGHSGGGFMSAAAMLVKPYNEFFKVAVASAGNHDNNIYSNDWAERYHGIKEVPLAREEADVSGAPPKEGRKATKPADDKGKVAEKKTEGDKKSDQKSEEKTAKGKDSDKKSDQKSEEKTAKSKDGDKTTSEAGKKDKEVKTKHQTRFEIKVPTNAELAANLKGRLLLVHGDMDNNVHPANTLRLVDALIKANKRFDLLIVPGKAHGFANYQPYVTERTWDYFAEYLLHDRPAGVDLFEGRERK